MLCILSICSPGQDYAEMAKVQTDYYSKFSNVKFYLVQNDEKQKEKIRIQDNYIYVRGTEHVLHVLYKTVVAMEWIKNTGIVFTHFIRTNVSTLVDIRKLTKYLESYPANFYGGFEINPIGFYNMNPILARPIQFSQETINKFGKKILYMLAPEKCPGVNDPIYFEMLYVSGALTVMSKDIFLNICENSHLLKYFLPDDIALSTYAQTITKISKIEINLAQFKFKSNDRKQDVINMKVTAGKLYQSDVFPL